MISTSLTLLECYLNSTCPVLGFQDEFHQRLKFNRRGLVAMANAGKDDNGSQFFFTLGAAEELQKKHTIFGKVNSHVFQTQNCIQVVWDILQ